MDFLSEFEAAAAAPMSVSKTPFFASRSRSSSTTTREDDISDISMGASENRPGGTYGGSDDCEEDELCVQWQGSQVNAVLDSFLVNTPRKERMGESSNDTTPRLNIFIISLSLPSHFYSPTLSTTTHATPSNRPPGPRARRSNALSSSSSKARSKLSSASTLPTITTPNEENALPPVAVILQQLTKQSDENLASPSSSSSAFSTSSRGSRQLGRPTSLGSDVFSTNRASAPRKALGRAVSGNAVIGRDSGSGIRDLKGKGKLRSDLWTVEEDEHHPAKRFKGDSAGNDTVHQPLKSGKGKERERDMPPPALPPEAGGRWQSRMASSSSSSSLRVPNGNGDIAQARTLSQEMMPPPPLAFNPRTSKPIPSTQTSMSTHTTPPMLPPDISGVPPKTSRYAGATTASSFSTAKKEITPPLTTKPPTSASSSAYQPNVPKYQNPHPHRQSSQASRGSQHRVGGLSQNPIYPPASSQTPRTSHPANLGHSKPPPPASSSQTPTTSHQPQPTTHSGPQGPTATLFSGPAPKARSAARLGMARSHTFNPVGTEPSYEVGTIAAASQPTSSSSSSSGSVGAANRSSCSYRSGNAGGGAGAHGVLSKAFRVPRSSAEVAKERVENLMVFLGRR
ncbi:hypothetical protein D9611_007816 [Ephemerocybe angulata]|uniref:Uncharacterized protein n=1 Tax=Ephemerocybe angulata TaxID=980116 RepID=A0A8H5CEE7_9AGAR|nr:hypothetical protein D9611_007816 [Tulosesus angulatus]